MLLPKTRAPSLSTSDVSHPSCLRHVFRTLAPLQLRRLTEMLTEVQAEPKPQVVNLKPVLTEHSYRSCCSVFSLTAANPEAAEECTKSFFLQCLPSAHFY